MGSVFASNSTHSTALATARTSPETARVSEPVYDYPDNKYDVKRFRMHSRLGICVSAVFQQILAGKSSDRIRRLMDLRKGNFSSLDDSEEEEGGDGGLHLLLKLI